MASVNKVFLLGNLGSDPEMKEVGSTKLAKVSLATTERWTAADGEKKERTEWHKLVIWGKQAEIAEKYLKKGKPVYVEGTIQSSEWETDAGEKRKSTDIRVLSFQMLGRKDESESTPEEGEKPTLPF